MGKQRRVENKKIKIKISIIVVDESCVTECVLQYLGLWYEQLRYFAIFEAGGICVTAEYTDQGEGVVGVNNTEYNSL
jgi:Bacterial lipocalin